jgi:uncharacterized protein (TIGR04551 family)
MDHMRGLDLGTARFSSDTPTGWVGSSRVPPALFHPEGSESVSQLSSANMRWRLEPTLNLSEKVQIHSRIDVFDNLVLGSTPDSFPGLTNNPSSPVSVFSASAGDPQAGVNSATDGLRVKHVYGDVLTPVGRLRFGRMASHFGLGLLANAGRGAQDDHGDAADRILFLTKIKGHVVGLAWDLAGEGPIGTGGGDGAPALGASEGYQAYDLGQLDDVDQYVLVVAKADAKDDLEKLLAAGKSSTNYGFYAVLRSQAWDFPWDTWYGKNYSGGAPAQVRDGESHSPDGAVRRDANALIGSLWFRRSHPKYRFELEAVGISGTIGSFATKEQDQGNTALQDVEVRQLGVAQEFDYKLAGGKMTVGLNTGYASGDAYAGWGLRPGTGQLSGDGRGYGDTRQFGCRTASQSSDEAACSGHQDRSITNFRFDPSYRVDNILFREVIGGVTDAWYVKPHTAYNLNKQTKLKASLLYGEALFAESTPGGERPLGIELDAGLHVNLKNRFAFHLDYGLLMPLAGLNMKLGNTTLEAQTAQRVMGTFLLRY